MAKTEAAKTAVAVAAAAVAEESAVAVASLNDAAATTRGLLLPGPLSAAHIPGKRVIEPLKPAREWPISDARSNLCGVTRGNPRQSAPSPSFPPPPTLPVIGTRRPHGKFSGPVRSVGAYHRLTEIGVALYLCFRVSLSCTLA